jgi:hypothetical protein
MSEDWVKERFYDHVTRVGDYYSLRILNTWDTDYIKAVKAIKQYIKGDKDMGKVVSFAELQGKVKVGWIVKEVQGKNSDHSFSGSGTQKVTQVDDNHFWINNCSHTYVGSSWLEVVKGWKPSWDNLSVGNILIDDDGDERVVLGTVGEIVFTDIGDGNKNIATDNIEHSTVGYMKAQGWKIKNMEDTAKEVTMDEIAKAMNINVKDLKIKKED